MTEWDDLNRSLDHTRIWILGSNEWTEMMVAMYVAVERCLSIEAYDNARVIIGLMKAEISAVEQGNFPDMYVDRLAHRKATWSYGEDFDDGDNQVDPRP